MRFFNFTKKTKKEEATKMANIDEVLRALDELSEDEKEKVRTKLKNPADKNGDGKETTSEQIETAAEHIAEKGADEQSVKDRIDESVAAQERAEGDKDSQTAKDRVDEALGEAKAEAAKEEDKYDARSAIAAIHEELRSLREMFAAANANPVEVKNDDAKKKLDEAASIYLN